MKHKKTGRSYLVRLEKDELLIEALVNWAKEHGITSAWVQGLGAVQWVKLGYYNLEQKEYGWRKVEETLEMASVQGNLTQVEGEPFFHLHGAFSDDNFATYSGHIQEAAIGGTGEFYITPFDETITRSHDNEVGLKLLDL